MTPEHVTLELQREEAGVVVRKKVYVTEVNGVKTLDLYSGWHIEEGQPKRQLSELPVKVCSLTSMERLWLSHNKLSTLPPQISQLTYLRELYLHENSFRSLPVELCRLPRLEMLWLNFNQVSSIPPEVVGLKTLKRLHLDHNCLEEIPPAICDLVSLEVLYLNSNQLKSIPECIGKLCNLQRLYLQYNHIPSIPRGICELTKIQMLFLDHNEITHIKREFQYFTATCENSGGIVSTKHNPFVTPQSKLKLSLGGVGGAHGRSYTLPLKTRRHSDQPEYNSDPRLPRKSLPEKKVASESDLKIRKAESLPQATLTHST